MTKPLDSLTVQKLAIAQQLLSRSVAAANEAGTLAPSIGISMAQDAIEFVLRAAIDHYAIPLPKIASFDHLIAALKTAGHTVPHQSRLHQINAARVGFKHSANLLNASQGRDLAVIAQTAADEICKALFNVSLWQISSEALIKRTRVRNHLNWAREYADNGDFEHSCIS
jgi:hypothetical protein